jgi:elongation factor 1-gamma
LLTKVFLLPSTVCFHTLQQTYLVGDKITLADIVVASALVYPFKLVADAEYRKPFPCVIR